MRRHGRVREARCGSRLGEGWHGEAVLVFWSEVVVARSCLCARCCHATLRPFCTVLVEVEFCGVFWWGFVFGYFVGVL